MQSNKIDSITITIKGTNLYNDLAPEARLQKNGIEFVILDVGDLENTLEKIRLLFTKSILWQQ